MLNKPLNICVMLGGPSAEREVSLRSGAAAARALRALGHTVRELDPAGSSWQLPPETEVVFLALHGTYGEDGGVQTRLEELGVPYTGCGPEASRTAFDKVLTKKRCLQRGHPDPALRRAGRAAAGFAARLDAAGRAQAGAARLQHRAAICGARGGSGRRRWRMRFVTTARCCWRKKSRAAKPPWASWRTAPCPWWKSASRMAPFDYRNKYTAGAARNIFAPPILTRATTAKIQAAALGAFRAIGGRDFARVDVMVAGRRASRWCWKSTRCPA